MGPEHIQHMVAPSRRRAHWAADGTLLLVGSGNKTAMQLKVNTVSGANGSFSEREVGARAFPVESASDVDEARAQPQRSLLALNHSEKWRGAFSGVGHPRCIALVASPDGRFAASVLDSLRVVLWDNASGASWLLSPPMSGGMQLVSGDADVSVSVASDGCSIALRVVFLRADKGTVRRAFASTPLWLFLATSPPDGTGGAAAVRHASLEGSWIMVGVPGSKEEACGCASSVPLSVAARCCAAISVFPAVGPQQRCEVGEERRVQGGGDWMLSTWNVAFPPEPSPFLIRHSTLLDALGIASPTNASLSRAPIPPRAQNGADVISVSGGRRGASGPVGQMAQARVQVGGMRIRTHGMVHADGMVLPADRCYNSVWKLQLQLPIHIMRNFQASCRRWMGAKLATAHAAHAAHAKVPRQGWRQRMSFNCCTRADGEDASEHSRANSGHSRANSGHSGAIHSEQDSAVRKEGERQGPDSPKGERTGSSGVSPLVVCWDHRGVRAGVLINVSEDESLVAVLEEKEVSKAWRQDRGGGGSWGKEEEGVRNTSVGLVMQRFVWLSDVLEGGLRSGADMAWDAGEMLLMVLTVDHRLVMLSRDGLPCRVITHPPLPSDARVDIAKLCHVERGGDDGGFEHQIWHENRMWSGNRMSYEIDKSSANSVKRQYNSVSSQTNNQCNRGDRVSGETAGGANMARWLKDSNSDELLPYQLLPFSGQHQHVPQQDNWVASTSKHSRKSSFFLGGGLPWRHSRDSSLVPPDIVYHRPLSGDRGIDMKRSSEQSRAYNGDGHACDVLLTASNCLDLSSFVGDHVVMPGL